MKTSRRDFFRQSSLAVSASWLALHAHKTGAAENAPLRAAIIGHTGHGDYGHGYDQIFKGFEAVSVVAVADPDVAGRQKAAERAGAARTYGDYREMLAKEKPQLVSIAMRHPEQHRAVALAAIDAGAHLFMEKPFTETVRDADAIIAAAEQRGSKIVVAHNRRYAAEFVRLRALLRQGFLGEVREVRMQGKQDTRAGGEDMMVLGTHDFDMLRFWFGDPLWCSACVLQGGREVAKADVHRANEPIRIAGDTIRAQFGFANNIAATWSSVRTKDQFNTQPPRRDNWAFEILGSRRVVAYHSGPGFAFIDSPYLLQPENQTPWQPLPAPDKLEWPEHQRHMARDLIHAVQHQTQPVCSGHDGRWAVEMVSAVYQSHFSGRRVPLPLTDRSDPLS